MLAKLFNRGQLLDENTREWVLDSFSWALSTFELTVFKNETQLILPTNEFYPGKVGSVHQMAQAVFDNSLAYAGMQHWPIKLVAPEQFSPQALPAITHTGALRGAETHLAFDNNVTPIIQVSYNPAQINQPQDLVASFAQSFASILITTSGSTPPGGADYYAAAIDLVACVMGFGVMFANTAYQFKGGCGSCYNAAANRQVALSEDEMTYCLALFTVLKNLDSKTVNNQLKSHLRSFFKRAVKEHKSLLMTKQHHLLLSVQE